MREPWSVYYPLFAIRRKGKRRFKVYWEPFEKQKFGIKDLWKYRKVRKPFRPRWREGRSVEYWRISWD